MQAFWEKLGVLGPIYRMVGEGLTDAEIGNRIKITENTVTNCVSWIMHSLEITSRSQLVARAEWVAQAPRDILSASAD
jgi:ATP/maltotriose-dependent transcriptional regulator MalT